MSRAYIWNMSPNWHSRLQHQICDKTKKKNYKIMTIPLKWGSGRGLSVYDALPTTAYFVEWWPLFAWRSHLLILFKSFLLLILVTMSFNIYSLFSKTLVLASVWAQVRHAHKNLLHNVVKYGYRYEISCAEIAFLDKITLDSLIESHEIRMHSKMT